MQILLSNDDGITSPGLTALKKVFTKWGKVTIVAPAFNRSTSGHALSLHKPLRLFQLAPGTYSVDGSPADCTHMALTEVMKQKPGLVISGINQGANLGQDVYYSGTVAAARECAISGIPSVAVSLVTKPAKKGARFSYQYEAGAKATMKTLELVLKQMGEGNAKRGLSRWPRGLVLNINVPNIPFRQIKGYRMAVQGRQIYGGPAIKRMDNRGQPYYWIGGTHKGFEKIRGTDCFLTDEGYVAITPLRLDCTDYDFITDYGKQFTN